MRFFREAVVDRDRLRRILEMVLDVVETHDPVDGGYV
jgi:hypothetical protein